jgi:hypothetical protein
VVPVDAELKQVVILAVVGLVSAGYAQFPCPATVFADASLSRTGIPYFKETA